MRRPARAKLRRFGGPAAGPKVTVDARTAYDFLVSLEVSEGGDTELLPEDQAWLSRTRAGLKGDAEVAVNSCFGEESFLDGVEIDHDTFYRRLQHEKVFPTTSQPSPGQFAEAYGRLAPEADGIVSIQLSSRLSGTFNSAVQGARASGASCPVEVVDSRSTSLGLGLIALEAARLARAGASLEEILAAVRGWVPRSRFCAALGTLDFLAKGGRIGRARHLLGTLARVRPVLALREGEVQPVRQLRTRAQVDAFLEAFARDHRPVQALGVVYSTGRSEAEALAGRLSDLCPRESIVLGRVGPGLGSHTGPGMLGIALIAGG